MIKILSISILLSVAANMASPTASSDQADHYTPDQIKADLDGWMQWLHITHPKLTYTIKDIDEFYAQVEKIRAGITGPLSRRDLWRKLTPLNKTLSDAHLMVGFQSNEQFLKKELTHGVKLFPFDVAVSEHNELIIVGKTDDRGAEFSGFKITSVNGVATKELLPEILQRQNGDTDLHRRILAGKRWSFLYLATFGSADAFNLVLEKNGKAQKISVSGHSDIQKTIYRTNNFEDVYSCKVGGNKTAYVKVGDFYWHDFDEYLAFMDSCFTKLKQAGTQKLVMDIRENGGGDDKFWIQGVMKYVAHVPYRHASAYQVRILAGSRDPGEVVGEVVAGELTGLRQPVKDVKNKFGGDFYLLVGPYTYSSAILFSNAVKDHAIGTMVGTPTAGKRGQTGGTQRYIFPNTGLKAVSPRFILQPPAGGDSHASVGVDIPLDTDGMDAGTALEVFMQALDASE